MAIRTLNDVVSGMAAQQRRPFVKNFTAAKAAGAFQSGWLATGQPGAGSAPPNYNAGSGYTCSSATTGALTYTNATVQNYLARLAAAFSGQAGTLYLYDRLWSCGNMGFAASTYTVTTPGSLPARITDGGVDCELWVEQFAAAGAASGTLTAAYLNTSGASKSGVISAVVSAPVIGQMQPIPLQAGDTGISQLTSLTNSATWTSGTFGATIMKRIAAIELPVVGVGQVADWGRLALPAIPADACLMFMFMASTTTAPVLTGECSIIDK